MLIYNFKDQFKILGKNILIKRGRQNSHSMNVHACCAYLTEKSFHAGISELSARDTDLAGVVTTWGNPPFWVHPPGFPGGMSP